jgi:glucose-6-phosphate isomerase
MAKGATPRKTMYSSTTGRNMANADTWQTFQDRHYSDSDLGVCVDVSRMGMPAEFFEQWAARMQAAFGAMDWLEGGGIANTDEKRMVGHYWLRAPHRAPAGLVKKIEEGIADVEAFARETLDGGVFDDLLLIGIGGSMLGPQFLHQALQQAAALPGLRFHSIDNTDPDGIDRTLGELDGRLDRTLVVVVSKSGGTPETWNGMLEVEAAFNAAGVPFPAHAVAVTEIQERHEDMRRLQRKAVDERWLKLFPMHDWVGGRTSVCSAVGLLPLALGGVDVRRFLAGAAKMDEDTRRHVLKENPAALLALSWLFAGRGSGERSMVVLPYSDRLSLFSKYLQQLVMESIGKEFDRKSKRVQQGLTVFGNKGSTDQHSYVQQLRDGPDDYFAVFIELLDRARTSDRSLEVADGVTSEDYLHAFLLGTRKALFDRDHPSTLITLHRLTPESVGALIALFERAVGLYAELIDVNAYHQPGVEAGKKAADDVLELQRGVLNYLQSIRPNSATSEDVAAALGTVDEAETVYLLLRRLASNPSRGVQAVDAFQPRTARFKIA